MSDQGDMLDITKNEGVTPTSAEPNGLSATYYSIDDRYVTCEETNTQFLVTYDNRFLLGEDISGAYKEKNKDGYVSAVSVACFDKDWNLQKLEVTETWDSITEDGQEYVRTRKVIVTYHDTSEDEMKKIFEEEWVYLESLMED